MTSQIAPQPEPRFCHQCGATLRRQYVAEEQRERLVCQGCGLIHYLNPRVVANAIPERDSADGRRRLLLMRRALEARWFTADAIPWDDLAFETTARALRDWVTGIRLG